MQNAYKCTSQAIIPMHKATRTHYLRISVTDSVCGKAIMTNGFHCKNAVRTERVHRQCCVHANGGCVGPFGKSGPLALFHLQFLILSVDLHLEFFLITVTEKDLHISCAISFDIQ